MRYLTASTNRFKSHKLFAKGIGMKQVSVQVIGMNGGVSKVVIDTHLGAGATLNLRELVANHEPCCEIAASHKEPRESICVHDYDSLIVMVNGVEAFTIKF